MGIFGRKPQLFSPNQRQRNTWFLLWIILGALGLAVFSGFWVYTKGTLSFSNSSHSGGTPISHSTPTPHSTPVPLSGVGVTKASDDEYIGISDGTFAFAVTGPGGNDKMQAAAKLKAGDMIAAESLWNSALNSDPGDAESLIYLEDMRVARVHANSGNPYITIVVGTMMTGDNASVGYDNLQGAYVAQKEYNDGAINNGGTLVRLLVASSGNDKTYATIVANQIVQLAKSDLTVVGVMGWPFSSRALAAIDVLTQAHIPMVSQTASSDSLTNRSPYFFRVNPSDTMQAGLGAKYVEKVLQAKNVALFVDNSDPYSESLANAFSTQFKNDGNTIVATEVYTEGSSGHAALPGLLQDAESKNPDLIYFSGYANDAGVLLANLPTSGPYAHLAVMGGDGLYDLKGYPPSAGPGFNRLRFTSFAYPDEWDVQHLTANKPAFFDDYIKAYNPRNQHTPGTYGYTRADGDVILSYDAMKVLLKACTNALAGGSNPLTPESLKQSLQKITGTQAIQGVSGQISFGTDGDPIQKAVVVLYIDLYGHVKLNGVQGCFLIGQCSSS